MSVRGAGVGVALTLVLALSGASGGVYDDVTAWWHLDDYGSSGPVGSADEIRDQRTWGAVGSYKATSLMGTPEWTAVAPTQGPGGGQVLGGRGMEFTPAVSGGVVTAPDGYLVSNLTLSGDATLVTRFRWDGIADAGQPIGWLYNNAHGANAGWLFGLNGANGEPRAYRYPQNNAQVGWTTQTDTWYDMAVTFESTGASSANVTFYRWEEGGAFQQSAPIAVNWDLGLTGSGTLVGSEAVSGGNARKAFDGTVENLAVWNRALSAADIHEAFGYSDATWSIGIDNGSNDDLRLEGQTDADYTVGEPWHEMRRAVSTGATDANVHFTLSADEANLAHVFHLDVHGTGGGSPLDLDVQVNGQSLGIRTVAGTSDQVYLVPASILSSGGNTLTLQRVGGTAAYVSWDWMELGGAWQVGYDDDGHAEFSHEGAAPDDFYVTDPNWLHLERAIIPTDPDINLHFFLSDELAQPQFPGMTYYYTTEILSQGGGTHPFDILLNGVGVANILASPDGTVVQVGLPWSLLQAGENVITLSYIDSTGNIVFDYHRMEIMPEPTTMTLLGLGGLALLRRRRRKR